MHDFDSYTLYEIKKVPYYAVRIQVILTEPVRGEILRSAAERAWQRFPYFSRSVAVDTQGVYSLQPCPKPVTVTPDDHAVQLGTPETNDLLFAVTYRDSKIFFNFSHNFCGACGAMQWIKATLWHYLTALGYAIDQSGILLPDTPIPPEECAEPDVESLSMDPPIGKFHFPMDAFSPRADYAAFYRNPGSVLCFYPITIPKKALMQYARENDGSPNSILSALLYKMYVREQPEASRFVASIACNYRADVGCPKTYRDMVRQLYVPYDERMRDWSTEKLSTVTRSRMYLQMQPEASRAYCRRVHAFRREIDAQPDLDSKAQYAFAHSPTAHGVPSSFVISYVGKIDWNGLAPYLAGVFTLTYGHLMLEVNATEEAFCISFQTLRTDRKYLNTFLQILDEEGIAYQIGDFEERKLPAIVLPD